MPRKGRPPQKSTHCTPLLREVPEQEKRVHEENQSEQGRPGDKRGEFSVGGDARELSRVMQMFSILIGLE